MGSGSPTWAITTPISPAGTWTQGYLRTPNIGQSLNRNPGMRSLAWYPASPRNATGLSSPSLRNPNRFATRPTCKAPIEWNDLSATMTMSATITAPTMSPPTVHLHASVCLAPYGRWEVPSIARHYGGSMAAPTPTVVNRRARHDYAIEDTFECGIILVGGEVKSIRDGKVVLRDAYARVENGEVWLYAMHISPYAFAREVDPDRRRKLLLNRREIVELTEATQNQGIALVPLKLYFKDRRVKVELGVGRGKKTYDKRQALAERDAMREAERSLKSSRR